MSKKSCRAAFAMFFVVAGPTSSLAANCWLNDDTKSGSPISGPLYSDDTNAGRMNHVVCGHSIIGAGCEVILNDDATGSSNTDCLRIGRGVKVTGQGHIFTCPANTDCGTAIHVEEPSGSGSGTTQINEVEVFGGWLAGFINAHYTVASEVNEARVDLSSVGVTASGILGFKTVTDSIVSNVNAGEGVMLRGGANLIGSIVHDCLNGVQTRGSGNIVQNSVIADCTVSMYRPFVDPAMDLKGVFLRNATNCHCGNGGSAPGTCTTLSTCATFSGTNNSFVDNTIE